LRTAALQGNEPDIACRVEPASYNGIVITSTATWRSVPKKYLQESDVGILGSLMRRRAPAVEHRTIDGGHPAPFPDMTDEQLYNYETTFNVARKTFDKPPGAAPKVKEPHVVPPPRTKPAPGKAAGTPQDVPRTTDTERREPVVAAGGAKALDCDRPVRTVTTRQPVEILTTRARHPIYKVHGYIGDDDVVTVFTLDGRLSENGPQFLENVPQKQQLHLNIYRNRETQAQERYRMTQHDSKEEADAQAQPGRIACVPVQFNL